MPVDTNEAVSAMEYARAHGDIWLDTITNVAAYWRGQSAFSAGTPVAKDNATTYSWTLPDHFPPDKYLRVSVDGGTVTQCGTELTWDDHGYYEISLDAGSVTVTP